MTTRAADRGLGSDARVLRRLWQRTRSAMWFWPVLAAAGAYVAGLLLSDVHPSARVARLLWPGDVAAASALLQVLAGSVVTATSLTFSLVVVALQLASQQFSPRLLRGFARSWVIQAVLAVLMATFVFSVTVLRELHADRALPSLALAVAFVLGLASVGALLLFLASIVRYLRIDTMMLRVHAETSHVLAQTYPPYGTQGAMPPGLPEPDATSTVVPAASSGFVGELYVEPLVDAAARADVLVWLLARPGDHVVAGTPLAAVIGPADAALERAVRDAVRLGYERTLEQDAAFGFRQVVDIAVKALSPAVNDPATAVHALGHLTDLLVRVTGYGLGPAAHIDAEGAARVVALDRDFRYYLDLSCAQIRRFGGADPTVLVAVGRLLRDVAVAARDDEQRTELRRQVRLVREASEGLARLDAEAVLDLCDRVEAALRGDGLRAYVDRSGETRST